MKQRYKPRNVPRYRTDEERLKAKREARKSWKKRHKEKIREANRRQYLKRKAEKLEAAKEYYQKNRNRLIQKAKERSRFLPALSSSETQEVLRTVENLLKLRIRQKEMV